MHVYEWADRDWCRLWASCLLTYCLWIQGSDKLHVNNFPKLTADFGHFCLVCGLTIQIALDTLFTEKIVLKVLKIFSQPCKNKLVNTHASVTAQSLEKTENLCNGNTLEHNLNASMSHWGRQLVPLTWQHISHSFLCKHTATTAFRHRSLKAGSGNRHFIEAAVVK